ncbi:hypothetical protein [Sphingomonas sp. PAMC 26621]|uniref:hypothetical protein n=1 Tax=Sphingomonas sp. PAMC 26621 TaxID=1112213 RepID=UPI000287F7E1|nr:hypothetical protein [Sphingomonas sp. PAMC 26621]
MAIISQLLTIGGGLMIWDAMTTGFAPDFDRHPQAMFSISREPAWFCVALLVRGAATAFFALGTGASVKLLLTRG